MQVNNGFFITFEGCEGCGKSTQSFLLFSYLETRGLPVIYTREPGGAAIAEAIRRILLDPENEIAPMTELFLYEAARAQHIADVVRPALNAGKIVICDRFTDATIAYQGYGRGIDTGTIARLNRIATEGLSPDLTIYLDIPVEQGLAKARSLNKDSFSSGDRLEREEIAFHRKVRTGYLQIAKANPRRVKMIPTAATIDETHNSIVAVAEKALKKTCPSKQ